MASRPGHRSSALLGAVLATLLAAAAALPVTATTMRPEIVGGDPAETGAYPFVAALLDDSIPGNDFNKQFCGGSLIAPDWILTAAHCVNGRKPKDIAVAIGRTRLDSDQGVRVGVTASYIHPQWHTPAYYAHDVALLRLDSTVETITPIQLAGSARSDLEAAGRSLIVVGWGNTRSSGAARFPESLREVSVPAVADGSCREVYASSFDPPTMVCAGDKGVDSCQGDSGGPLFSEESGGDVQVGTVSFGIGCATSDHPGVYAELDNPDIRAWISDTSGV